MAATCLWANYLVVNPAGITAPGSGFIYIGTGFGTASSGFGALGSIPSPLYTVTALTPAVFAASNKGLGQDGLNPLPAAAIHAGDTVTLTTLGTVSTSVLAGLIRVCG